MTPDEWKGLALTRLAEFDHGELATRISSAQNEENISRFMDWVEKWKAARLLNPEIDIDQFNALLGMQARKGKGGGRPADAFRGERLLWHAARAALDLKAYWPTIRLEDGPKRPPVHFHEIVAEHYGLSRQQVDDYVRRGRKRWPDKTAP